MIIKDFSDFPKRARSKDGLASHCLECNKSSLKRHYNENKSVYHERNKKVRTRNKEFIWNLLKDKTCMDCGLNNPLLLEFDHLDDKSYNIANMINSHSIQSISDEVLKCEIVCANCHRLRTYERMNTWYFQKWKEEQ